MLCNELQQTTSADEIFGALRDNIENAYALTTVPTRRLNVRHNKTCLKQPLSKRPKMVFNTNYRLMQDKSIAKGYHLSLRSLFCLFLRGRIRQVYCSLSLPLFYGMLSSLTVCFMGVPVLYIDIVCFGLAMWHGASCLF